MAKVTYVFRVDDLENALLIELEGTTEAEVIRQGVNVKERIQALIRQRAINGGEKLASSVYGQVADFYDDDQTFTAVIASDLPEALWFEEGTGLFGPRKSFIFPRHAKYMVFKPYGKSRSIFAVQTRGQKGKHPFRDGLNQAVGAGGNLRRLVI